MNILEKSIHNLIGDYPYIRKPVVSFYQRCMAIIPVKEQINNEKLTILPGYFFGFHDKKPWNKKDSFHLAHKFNAVAPCQKIENGPIEYGIFDGADFSNFISMGKTQAWNWQQGASLQWIGCTDDFVVNHIINGRAAALIHSISSDIKVQIPHHIASVDSTGTYGLSYCFARLGQGAKGYGYHLWLHPPLQSSLLVIDLQSLVVFKEITHEQIQAMYYDDSMRGAVKFFSHGLFSPSEKKFMFYYQWLDRINRKLSTRLFSFDIDNDQLYGYELDNCSHISWLGDDRILAYCKPKNAAWGYYSTKVAASDWLPIAQDISSDDGHPQCFSNSLKFITDTYPNRYRLQNLYLHDINSGSSKLLMKARIPFKYRHERRCDYHPRWDSKGTRISFDSAHTGVRSLCILKL